MMRTEITFKYPVSGQSLEEHEQVIEERREAFLEKYRAFEQRALELCVGREEVTINQLTIHIHPNSKLPNKMTFQGSVKLDD